MTLQGGPALPLAGQFTDECRRTTNGEQNARDPPGLITD